MKVAMCVSEAVPFAKTGGLADVAGALPGALKKAGVRACVIMPGYGFIFERHPEIEKVAENIMVSVNPEYSQHFDLYTSRFNDIDFYFVKNDRFFTREGLYGNSQGDFSDNSLRFGFFSKAVFKVFEKIDLVPDIIHLHDYHFALVSLLLKDMQLKNPESRFKDTKIVFTIHNIAYQGIFGRETLGILGIGYEYFSIEGVEFYGRVNFMKTGIVYSDCITTVSPTYAKEILTEEYGYGLEGILKSRQQNLFGIINGIDYGIWNPQTDTSIAKNYDIRDISGKRACKKALISDLFGLKGKTLETALEKPLAGMVSRLSEQKGIDLITGAMDNIMKNDLFLVILGSGDDRYQRLLLDIQKKFSNCFSLTLGYSDQMSREIYSGSDIFLMPSKYEPCGLGQLISLKYGTVPVVRDTGGLSDTIVDINTDKDIKSGGQGFKFSHYQPEKFYKAFKRALDFYADSKLWHKIMANAMMCNFSWDYSAEKYSRLYTSIAGGSNKSA